jgi:site-specific DNA-methyltransferase (adenine-specific)
MPDPSPPAYQLWQGDCLDILPTLPAASVHLVYLDPPFFTQKTHTLATRDRQQQFSFADIWASHLTYAEFLYQRLLAIKRVLHPHGAIFCHCDRHANHIVRLLLDELFGADQFRAEIIWQYKRWSNAQKNLLPAHQTIFYYTHSDQYTFHPLYEEYSPTTNIDQIWQRRTRDEYGKAVYALGTDGTPVSHGRKKGVPLSDVWQIPYLNPKAKERTGYPTQKPILLLERLITLASHEGDVVLDPFCGSGTTLVAAQLLRRQAWGIDIAPEAIALTKSRLAAPIKSESNLLKRGSAAYRQADETALALLQGLDIVPVQRNQGIDAFLRDGVGEQLIPIRVQRADETLWEAAQKLSKAAQGKPTSLLFLVALQEGGYLALGEELPPGVVVIDSPALAIRQWVATLQAAI